MLDLFMSQHSHGISECLLMASLGDVRSLRPKWKSNCSYMKMETTWKWKHDLKKKKTFKQNL